MQRTEDAAVGLTESCTVCAPRSLTVLFLSVSARVHSRCAYGSAGAPTAVQPHLGKVHDFEACLAEGRAHRRGGLGLQGDSSKRGSVEGVAGVAKAALLAAGGQRFAAPRASTAPGFSARPFTACGHQFRCLPAHPHNPRSTPRGQCTATLPAPFSARRRALRRPAAQPPAVAAPLVCPTWPALMTNRMVCVTTLPLDILPPCQGSRRAGPVGSVLPPVRRVRGGPPALLGCFGASTASPSNAADSRSARRGAMRGACPEGR